MTLPVVKHTLPAPRRLQNPRRLKPSTKRKAGTFWAVSSVGGTFWAVSRVGGIFLAEAVQPKYGGIFSAVMQYGGNVLVVRRRFSFFGCNDFGGRRYNQNMAVNRHITWTAYQGGSWREIYRRPTYLLHRYILYRTSTYLFINFHRISSDLKEESSHGTSHFLAQTILSGCPYVRNCRLV